MKPSSNTAGDHTPGLSREDPVRPVSTHPRHSTSESPDTERSDVHTSPPGPAAHELAQGQASSADRAPRLTRASAAWAAVTGALLLSVVLIVFVLQNPTTVVIHFLGWSGSLAVGMAMLIAAVTGGLLVATIGVARLTQLRIRARRTRTPPR